MNRRGFISAVFTSLGACLVAPLMPVLVRKNKLAEGGIIDSPRLAIIGEQVHEQVIYVKDVKDNDYFFAKKLMREIRKGQAST